jgi:endonuclease YncB( thermonuclease family)
MRIVAVTLLAISLLISQPGRVLSEDILTVSKVVNCGVVELSNGEEVRLIGIKSQLERSDAPIGIDPETFVSYEENAKEVLIELLTDIPVKLVRDELYSNINYRDESGRLLAYVVPADREGQERFVSLWRRQFGRELEAQESDIAGSTGESIRLIPRRFAMREYVPVSANAFLILFGYSPLFEDIQFDKRDQFQRLEMMAKLNARGLWR